MTPNQPRFLYNAPSPQVSSSYVYSFIMDNVPLKICSYNCRGYNNSKSGYINELLSKVDMLCLQQHWFSKSELSVLGC